MKATRLLKTTLAVTLLLSTTAVSMVSADELAVTYSTGQISDQPEPAYVPPPVYAPPVAVQTPVVMPAAPPQFVFVPEIGFYVATGVGFDLMFDGIAYYFHDRGHWFRTSYYGGSWEPIRRTILPELIVRYKIVDIRRHSAVEFKRFEHEINAVFQIA